MGTYIRNKISDRNKWKINDEKYLELKHFCLQYPDWKKELSDIKYITARKIDYIYSKGTKSTLIEDQAIKIAELSNKISLIDNCAFEADEYLANYIIKGVTEGKSYPWLEANMEIPAGRDVYYDRYRKFFWLLDKYR